MREKIHFEFHYHDKCQDGLGALASAMAGVGNHSFTAVPRTIGMPSNQAYFKRDDAIVVYMDYCPSLEELTATAENQLVVVLDHHKTSEKTLSGLGTPVRDLNELIEYYEKGAKGVLKIFDMNKSGAGISWDFFNPGKDRPRIINAIEKRDLWIFDEESVDLVSTVLYAYQLKAEDILRSIRNETEESFNEIKDQGRAILNYKNTLVSELAKSKHLITLTDYTVMCVLNSHILQSELGNYMLETTTHSRIAVVYHVNSLHHFVKISLRGHKGDSFARRVAEKMGGGGHDSASGVVIKENSDVSAVIQKITHYAYEVLNDEEAERELPENKPF